MSTLDDLGIKPPEILFVSTDLYYEYHARRRDVMRLRRIGTHPAEVRAAYRALGDFARKARSSGMSGGWAISVPPER